jgi:transglutaminase-like putative cysteine protease
MTGLKRHAMVIAALLLAAVHLACNAPIPTETLERTPIPTTARPGTATPLPTSTLPVEQACVPDAAFVSDVTVLDNATFSPGQEFAKVWELRNSGDCPWPDDARLVFESGNRMGGPESVPAEPVGPGSATEIGVSLVAPEEAGTYRGNWRLATSEGTSFGPQVWVQIVVPPAGGSGIAELFLLQGVFAQRTSYTYTVEFDRGGESAIDYSIAGVRTFSQAGHTQTVISQHFVGDPSVSTATAGTDALDNEYFLLHWDSPPDHLAASRIVQLETTTSYGPIYTTTPYPVPAEMIGADLGTYLQSTSLMQSDDPAVRAKAQEIVAGATSELEAVVWIVNWVRHNTEFACPRCEGITYADAATTLQELKGNCVNFANLAVALIRAAGIPCRRIFGFVADREYSYAGHAWIAVYYPDLGWVEYETSNWMPAYRETPTTFLLPQHITILHYGAGSPFSGNVSSTVEELHESSYVITSRPSEVGSVSASASPGQTVGYVVTLRQLWTSEIKEYTIALEDAPPGWHAGISDGTLEVDPDGASLSRDLLLTVTVPPGTPAGTSAVVSVVASSGGEEVDSVDVTINVGP